MGRLKKPKARSKNSTLSDAIMYMIHHVFLPPQLPQEDDFDPEHEMKLLNIICETMQMFKACAKPDQQEALQSASTMMESLRRILDDLGFISEHELKDVLQELSTKGIVIHLGTTGFSNEVKVEQYRFLLELKMLVFLLARLETMFALRPLRFLPATKRSLGEKEDFNAHFLALPSL